MNTFEGAAQIRKKKMIVHDIRQPNSPAFISVRTHESPHEAPLPNSAEGVSPLTSPTMAPQWLPLVPVFFFPTTPRWWVLVFIYLRVSFHHHHHPSSPTSTTSHHHSFLTSSQSSPHLHLITFCSSTHVHNPGTTASHMLS